MANENQDKGSNQFAFEKINYILTAAGALLVVIGFFLMSGGGSDDPAVFSEEVFSFRRLTLAPIVICGGYALVLYAIMKKPS